MLALVLCLSLVLSFSSCSIFSGDGDTSGGENQNGTADGGENEKEQGVANNPDTPAHTHTFADATCTTPKKCSCGATEGEALGHEWTTPDVDLCEVQSTCSRCGATDGETRITPPRMTTEIAPPKLDAPSATM